MFPETPPCQHVAWNIQCARELLLELLEHTPLAYGSNRVLFVGCQGLWIYIVAWDLIKTSVYHTEVELFMLIHTNLNNFCKFVLFKVCKIYIKNNNKEKCRLTTTYN